MTGMADTHACMYCGLPARCRGRRLRQAQILGLVGVEAAVRVSILFVLGGVPSLLLALLGAARRPRRRPGWTQPAGLRSTGAR